MQWRCPHCNIRVTANYVAKLATAIRLHLRDAHNRQT